MLSLCAGNDAASLYEFEPNTDGSVKRLVLTSKETRAVCNNPLVCGVQYTQYLQKACMQGLRLMRDLPEMQLQESQTIVFNILRGGLNFGLREALGEAYGWNLHGSSFISAQRARKNQNPEEWHIVENDYKKVYMPRIVSAVLGDVVASGTSLLYALHALLDTAVKQDAELRSIVFFTIGGRRSDFILNEIDTLCRQRFGQYRGALLVYIEGRFTVPNPNTNVSIKITGTDLLRRDAEMTPEFLASQYEHPTYPLERCTIYDAGSRAFWIPDYLEDVGDYWEQTLHLAEKGMTFQELLQERCPILDASVFGEVDLTALCRTQLGRIRERLRVINP